ncbi:M protein, serotype 2.1-like [Patiria miniata]|uniref:Uncharacterized protein n=1 Tax=Patiria miniata TaxID=46514 RepID=A0A914BTH7_PATMI|nr:M protein, serotype 2.1-like [Patiria miniata]
MAKNSEAVAKLVQQKLEDYFNRQRVENEFDPSGKGIHTTTPAVVQLELSYLQAAEQQWKANKKKKKSKNGQQKTTDEQGDGWRSQSRENESPDDGNEATPEVSPRVTKNSRIKSRVKGSEIDRITKNAQTTLDQVSVDKIQSVHRYRPHLILSERLDIIKVARVSHHVDAILNTEHALDCAEENDDREAARKYVEEKNDPERKERDQRDEPEKAEDTGSQRKRTPLWLRVEMEKAQREAKSDRPRNQQTREEIEDGYSSDECQEMAREGGEVEEQKQETREVTDEEKDLSADHQEIIREDEMDETSREGKCEDNEKMRKDVKDEGNKTNKNPSDGNSEIKNACRESENEVDEDKTVGQSETNESKKEFEGEKRVESDIENKNKGVDGKVEQGKVEPLNDATPTEKSVENEQSDQSDQMSQQGNEKKNLNVKQKRGKRKTKQDLPNGDLQNGSIEDDCKIKAGDGNLEVQEGEAASRKPQVDGIGEQGGKDRGGEESVGQDRRGQTSEGQDYRTEVYVRSESVVSLTAAVNEDEQGKG